MINSKIVKCLFSVLICFVLVFSSSCTGVSSTEEEKISIVCTAFSQYDFVREILGEKKENFTVKYLFDNGADVHSFETDIGFDAKISVLNSDLFIYNGGESDGWAKDILADNSMNKKCKIITLMESLDKNRLIHYDHEEHGDNSCDEEHDTAEYDEHVWLSLENAITICRKISMAIISADEKNKDYYEENTENYCNKLFELHNEASNIFSEVDSPFIIVADRFPFAYFCNDYNIKYEAAFSGCTSETEATYENVVNLCKAVESHSVNYLFVLEKSNSNISSSVISAISRKLDILTLNSLQSVSRAEIDNGLTYYSAMKNNIETVKKALEI